VWLVSSLPWIWAIPANQYFWDDWAIKAQVGLADQVNLWADGAKHPLNPWIYFALLHAGPWLFQLFTFLSTLAGAWALGRIAGEGDLVPASIVPWTRLLFLVLPVYHARFSIAVFEYSLALSFLLVAWALLLSSQKRSVRSVAGLLLCYSIGVPSIALFFPILYCHLLYLFVVHRRTSSFVAVAMKNSFVLVIPVVYSLVFSMMLDSRGKYEPSVGAVVEFGRLFAILLAFGGLVIIAMRRLMPSKFISVSKAVAVGIGAYVGLLPYFAVGYNPLSDFLPWRMREDARLSMGSRLLAIMAIEIAVLAVLAVPRQRSKTAVALGGAWSLLALPAVGLAVATVVFGPMDWDSRLWLLSWPVLAIFFALVVVVAPMSHQQLVASLQVAVLLTSSIMISCEYVADALKQRALVAAVDDELRDRVDLAIQTRGSLFEVLMISDLAGRRENALKSLARYEAIVIINMTPTSQNINARFRGYRGYEWAGLLGEGLGRDPRALYVLDGANVPRRPNSKCETEIPAILVAPTVKSSRTEVLLGRSAHVAWNSDTTTVCLDESGAAWFRK
jgi:hypothetical protein